MLHLCYFIGTNRARSADFLQERVVETVLYEVLNYKMVKYINGPSNLEEMRTHRMKKNHNQTPE